MKLSNERLWQVLKFLILFNLLAIPLYLIFFFKISLYPLQLLERDETSFILLIFGVNHERTDFEGLPSIKMGEQSIVISEACTAWRSILAFLALVIASPRSWRFKKNALIGVPLIYLFNLIRLATICLISLILPSVTDFIHTILWREGLMLVIFVLWYYWFTRTTSLVQASV